MPAEDPRRYIRIHADLSARIKDGRLPSGTLLSIGLIADEWSVARETVQRAIRRLTVWSPGIPASAGRSTKKKPPPTPALATESGGVLFPSRQAPRLTATLATGEIVSAMAGKFTGWRSEEHTSELQSLRHLVC